MPQSAQTIPDDRQLGDGAIVLGAMDPAQEDVYWERTFQREHYYRPHFDYEDYAPAYCVGYVGYAQYGGDYADAESSLWANWERIKGDSRLSQSDARAAMRAAWDRMAGRSAAPAPGKVMLARLLRQRLRMPSFRLGATALRERAERQAGQNHQSLDFSSRATSSP